MHKRKHQQHDTKRWVLTHMMVGRQCGWRVEVCADEQVRHAHWLEKRQ